MTEEQVQALQEALRAFLGADFYGSSFEGDGEYVLPFLKDCVRVGALSEDEVRKFLSTGSVSYDSED